MYFCAGVIIDSISNATLAGRINAVKAVTVLGAVFWERFEVVSGKLWHAVVWPRKGLPTMGGLIAG